MISDFEPLSRLVSPNSEPHQDSEEPVKRHEELWYEDGNIVLIAANVAFRVHRSILSRRSLVFNDLFSFPQPGAVETYEGFPVIHLSDRPGDLAQLLDAVYSGMKFLQHDVTSAWKDLRALILLSNKYQIEDIQKEAIHELESCYEFDTLDTWDSTYITTVDDGLPFVETNVEYLQIARVARLLGLNTVYPPIMYDCCQLSEEDLIRGLHSEEDDTIIRIHEDDLVLCMKAKSKLKDDSYDLWRSLLRPPNDCEEENCQTNQERMRQAIDNDRARLLSHDPLYPSSSRIAELCAEHPICASCSDTLKKQFKDGRTRILERIKSYFPPP